MEHDSPIDTNLNSAPTADAFDTPETPRSATVMGRLYEQMSPFERLLSWAFGLMLLSSTFVLVADFSMKNTVVVPARGGTLTEGIVGAPRFINPLLAVSDADRDLSTLVFSGLVRPDENGIFQPDVASDYTINETGTEYVFTIRPDATFHDGKPLTAHDVLFTVNLAQNPNVKSPKRADWEGVTAEVVDNHTIRFTLPRPYGPFLENATLGILPQHSWEGVSSEELPFHELNTDPIGSGPFKIDTIVTREGGSLVRVELSKFRNFTLGEPYLNRIIMAFYPNEDQLVAAFNASDIDTIASISPERVAELTRSDSAIHTSPLSRTFAVFFNQSKSEALSDLAVRRALDTALDKEAIIEHVLRGYGVALEGPIPRSPSPALAVASTSGASAALHTESTSQASTTNTAQATAFNSASSTAEMVVAPQSEGVLMRVDAARAMLDAAGWKVDPATGVRSKGTTVLTVNLATGNAPELVATANEIAHTWEALGVAISLETYNTGELNTNVIRPRDYEALLFGEIVGRSLDLFAFWHSTQRTDPGLNLAMYANPRADRLLADGRATADIGTREATYAEFSALIKEDVPAVFIYAPEYVYVTPATLQNIDLGTLTTAADRFANAHTWYKEVERVWPIFASMSELPQ